MSDLLDRLKAATGPSRELDDALRDEHTADVVTNREDWREAPHYTGSIDVALTLPVPEELSDKMTVELCIPAKAGFRKDPSTVLYFEGATPPLAVCIARLNAREATG